MWVADRVRWPNFLQNSERTFWYEMFKRPPNIRWSDGHKVRWDYRQNRAFWKFQIREGDWLGQKQIATGRSISRRKHWIQVNLPKTRTETKTCDWPNHVKCQIMKKPPQTFLGLDVRNISPESTSVQLIWSQCARYHSYSVTGVKGVTVFTVFTGVTVLQCHSVIGVTGVTGVIVS